MGGTLYTGANLRDAALRSTVSRGFSDNVLGLRNAVGILHDTIRYRRIDAEPAGLELTRLSAPAPGNGGRLAVTYAGHGENRDWCLSTVFDRYDRADTRRFPDARALASELRGAARDSNIVFTEGISGAGVSPTLSFTLTLPSWVRQRVRINADWQVLVDGLRRGTRQEISRLLRKYEYGCRLTRSPEQFDHFFENLYRPHIERRHGESALLVDRERFLRECRRGVVLQLTQRDSVIAAALLRRVAGTMAVIWCGVGDAAAVKDLRGTTDVLDYLSMLYANLKGCRWLDLGRSRPDLNDGLLRYKRKWGAELTAGVVPQTTLTMTCAGGSAGERHYLRRHTFLCRRHRRFRALLFVDGDTHADELQRTLTRVMTPGITEYRIVALSPVSQALQHAVDRLPYPVSLTSADSTQTAIRVGGR